MSPSDPNPPIAPDNPVPTPPIELPQPPVPPSPPISPAHVPPTPPVSPTPTPPPVPQGQGQVIQGGFNPAASSLPGETPKAFVGSFEIPGQPPSTTPPGVQAVTIDQSTPVEPIKGRRGFLKPLLIAVAGLLIVGGATATAYYGYYMNPTVVYKQALGNTGKGYGQLVNYFDKQSTAFSKGMVGQGGFTAGSGDSATDGNLGYQDDGKGNINDSLNVNLGTGRLSLDVREIKSTTVIPDFYFKVDGLDKVAQQFGVGSQYSSLNNQWIMIDRSYFTDFTPNLSLTSVDGTNPGPTKAQFISEADAFGKVNQDYMFSTNKNKAVLTVVKKVGLENTNGHKAFRYRVTYNKANLKKYIAAQKAALKSSQLNQWIVKNKYQNEVDMAFDSLQQSADNVSTKNTFDLWADVHTRLLYKVRTYTDPNKPDNNYTEFGLDYKKGSSYPFFINYYNKGSEGTDTGTFVVYLDSKKSDITAKLNVKTTGSYKFNLDANFSLKPDNHVPAISAPTSAKPLSQVLNELGLGDAAQGLSVSHKTIAAPASDSGAISF